MSKSAKLIAGSLLCHSSILIVTEQNVFSIFKISEKTSEIFGIEQIKCLRAKNKKFNKRSYFNLILSATLLSNLLLKSYSRISSFKKQKIKIKHSKSQRMLICSELCIKIYKLYKISIR